MRDRIRRRAKVIVKKNITKGGGNLSKKEDGVLENIRRRKDICVQQAGEGCSDGEELVQREIE